MTHSADHDHRRLPTRVRARAPKVPADRMTPLDRCLDGAVRECVSSFMATLGRTDGTRSQQIRNWQREFETTIRVAERAASDALPVAP